MFIQEVAENQKQPVPGGGCRLTRCPHMEQLATFTSFCFKTVWVRNCFGVQPGNSPAPCDTAGSHGGLQLTARLVCMALFTSLAPRCRTGRLGSAGAVAQRTFPVACSTGS